ncbi:MAG: glucosaminidase domain-containing protein [Peptostreptococcaceae bacterium]|nr:glucosaminidase domain-containing protein [Peptostreptococcaceae bacterium]
MDPKSYFDKMSPYAAKASAALGIPKSVILAQWSWETAFGTNRGSKDLNNHGGIKYVGASTQGYESGMYAGYATIDSFVDDYVRVLSLRYYDDVRKAGATPGINDDVVALGASPYAESGYANGNNILQRIKQYGLITFDGASSTGSVASDTLAGVKAQSDKIVYSKDTGLFVAVGAAALLLAGIILDD